MNILKEKCTCDLSPAALVKRHSTSVLRAAVAICNSRYAADDIVQNVFLQLVRTQPAFENDRHAKSWLLRVTINCCKDLQRSAWSSKVSSLDEMQENQVGTHELATKHNVIASAGASHNASAEHDPEQALAQTEQQQSVYKAVASLPPYQRSCIHLFYFEDLNIAEIASVIEQPSATVKSHLHRGRKKLHTILGEEYDYEA
ncbi:MAG: sigma-70 family RNA polymerase sigma factor [Coriobacteriia bacterium]|nr:sigma-70 family RNA polymerase sigma factor [Coriobacteriia bacterium]